MMREKSALLVSDLVDSPSALPLKHFLVKGERGLTCLALLNDGR